MTITMSISVGGCGCASLMAIRRITLSTREGCLTAVGNWLAFG